MVRENHAWSKSSLFICLVGARSYLAGWLGPVRRRMREKITFQLYLLEAI